MRSSGFPARLWAIVILLEHRERWLARGMGDPRGE